MIRARNAFSRLRVRITKQAVATLGALEYRRRRERLRFKGGHGVGFCGEESASDSAEEKSENPAARGRSCGDFDKRIEAVNVHTLGPTFPLGGESGDGPGRVSPAARRLCVARDDHAPGGCRLTQKHYIRRSNGIWIIVSWPWPLVSTRTGHTPTAS
jgi:hypothetical protein